MPVVRAPNPRENVYGVLALVQSSTEPNAWIATSEQSTVLRMPQEKLIFLDDPCDALSVARALAERFPPSHPALRRYRIDSSDGECIRSSRDRVVLLGYEVYPGRDAEEACDAARQLGKIRLQTNHWYYPEEKAKLVAQGCYVRYKDQPRRPLGWKPGDDEDDWDNECYYELVYGPEVVDRRESKKEVRQRKCAMPVHELERFVYYLRWNIGQLERMPHCIDCGCNSSSTMASIMDLVALFNILYGRNAHRRLEAFHQLMAAWRVNPEHTAMIYRRRYPNTEAVGTFCDWMMAEAKARKQKAQTKFPVRFAIWRYLPGGKKPKKPSVDEVKKPS